VEEEVRLRWMARFAFRIEDHSRDDDVDVGVVLELSSPGKTPRDGGVLDGAKRSPKGEARERAGRVNATPW
jgi:hypothetical protein